jgi:hypothetical protein
VRRAGDRETAPALARQHDVEVLPGKEVKRFDRRQLQEDCHHVGRQQLARDAARQVLISTSSASRTSRICTLTLLAGRASHSSANPAARPLR